LAVASVIVVAALERAPAPILVAVAGLVPGALIGLAVLQLGVLAGGLALRPRMPRVVIGVGPRLKDWTAPGRSITPTGTSASPSGGSADVVSPSPRSYSRRASTGC